MDIEVGISRLEAALRELLGANFESELRASAEEAPWYHSAISATDLFRFRVWEHLERGNDGMWVLELLRGSERKFLAVKVGIDRAAIVGKSPAQLASDVLVQVGLPATRIAGLQRLRAVWDEVAALIDADEDEKAAVLGRQRAERLLRNLLFFYCSCAFGTQFLELLLDPGSMRLPPRLGAVLKQDAASRCDALLALLRDDGWAELGFLSLAVRKLASRLDKEGARTISGLPLNLMSAGEADTFTGLGTALQPYAHDKPSLHATRHDDLAKAVAAVRSSVLTMVTRGVIPDELLVLERCESLLGPVFRGTLESGDQLRLVCERAPPLGKRILFVPAARRDFARCHWSESPWPVE
jgi:hypothetical protein